MIDKKTKQAVLIKDRNGKQVKLGDSIKLFSRQSKRKGIFRIFKLVEFEEKRGTSINKRIGLLDDKGKITLNIFSFLAPSIIEKVEEV